MRGLLALLSLSFISSGLCVTGPSLAEIAKRYTRQTERGVHIPIVRRGGAAVERRGIAASIGLGDYEDVTYNVLVTVGGVTVPVVLDTGSSDLWVLSDACRTGCTGDVSLYPQSTFQSVGLELELKYGDSQTGTYAVGLIGKDTVDLAGITLSNQYFGAINNTNTSITNTGSAGIFGLGFPYISVIFGEVFESGIHSSSSRRSLPEYDLVNTSPIDLHTPTFPHLADFLKPESQKDNIDFHRPAFPHLADVLKKASGKQTRQVSSGDLTTLLFQSYDTMGPFLSRLVANGQLNLPMFAVTLQRNSIDIGGNVGTLSIGELPDGIKNDSLTWVPVRLYPSDMTGISAPQDSPDEEYPIAWEVFVNDVFLDGVLLPRSNLSSPDIGLSALLDTGNSLLRGPDDVVQLIRNTIGTQFDCSEPHTLAFQIGKDMFPVDPRDFIRQAYVNDVSTCSAAVVSTDPPGKEGSGYLFSWSLGMPFLKGVLSAYHYGNLSYPSQDFPMMGLLSTVPADADQRLVAAVQSASKAGGGFPASSQSAPSGTISPASTNANGVPEASAGTTNSNRKNASESQFKRSWGLSMLCIVGIIWTTMI